MTMLQIGDFFREQEIFPEIRKHALHLMRSGDLELSHIWDFIASDIQEQWSPSKYSIPDLLFMDQNTLGFHLCMHLMNMVRDQDDIHGVPAPTRFPLEQPVCNEKYIELRIKHTHDILHVLTGFNTSPFGETALQAFYVAQSLLPLSALYCFRDIGKHICSPNEASHTQMYALAAGLEAGLKAADFCALRRLEEFLSEDLDQVRNQLQIHVSVGHPWSINH